MNERLETLLQAISEIMGIPYGDMKQRSKSHKTAHAKHVFCYIGCYKLKIKQQDIGDFIGLSQGRVCQVTDHSQFIQRSPSGVRSDSDEVQAVVERYNLLRRQNALETDPEL